MSAMRVIGSAITRGHDHVALDDRQEAFAWPERAVERRDLAWLLYFMSADPWADGLRSDRRFRGLLSVFHLDSSSVVAAISTARHPTKTRYQ